MTWHWSAEIARRVRPDRVPVPGRLVQALPDHTERDAESGEPDEERGARPAAPGDGADRPRVHGGPHGVTAVILVPAHRIETHSPRTTRTPGTVSAIGSRLGAALLFTGVLGAWVR